MGCQASKDAAEAASPKPNEATTKAETEPQSGGAAEVVPDERRRSVVHKAPEVDSGTDTPFDPTLIGTLTRHGIAPARGPGGIASKAKINQDRGIVCWPFNGTHNQALLCVFDGHGINGERLSEWCVQQIPVRLEEDRDALKSDTVGTLSRAICKMDYDMLTHPLLGNFAKGAGSTSNVLYFHGTTLWTACSGDSRAVLGRWAGGGKAKGSIKSIDLSIDHKPDLPEEQKRIEREGGVVSKAGPRGLPPSRVWVNGRVGLAMSRSIGDGEAKGHGVIPDPEIQETTLSPASDDNSDGDAFVVVASDGIWEFISSQEACEVVAKHDTATAACEELVQLAVQRWEEEEGSYRDDITCIIAFLPFLEDRADEDYSMGLDKSVVHDEAVMLEAKGGSFIGDGQGASGDGDGEDFVKRRLSVAQPFDA